MKKALLFILILVFYTPSVLTAQKMCQDYFCNIAKAKTALANKKFKEAIDYCKAAKAYPNANIAEADALIYKVFDAIEAQKKIAEEATKKSNIEAEKAKRAQEDTEKALKQVQIEKKTAIEAEKKAKAVLDKIYFYDDKFGLAYDKEKNRYGFIDKDLRTKIGFKYYQAFFFNESGFAVVYPLVDDTVTVVDRTTYEQKIIIYNDRKKGNAVLIDTFGNEYTLCTEIAKLNKDVVAIDLSYCSLNEVPKEIWNCPNLKYLFLKGNNIETIPDEIQKLKKLELFDASENNITQLPENFSENYSLKTFNLEGNMIRKASSFISKLRNLEVLRLNVYLSDDLINELYELRNLKTLYLDVYSNYNNIATTLRIIPFDISNLSNLTSLSLLNQGLDSLPLNIDKLNNLIYLNLSGNGMMSLTNSFAKLTKLRKLYLGNNGITLIDPTTYESEVRAINVITVMSQIESLTNLTLLDLSNNRLESVPSNIDKLTNLEVLNLKENQITKEEQEKIKKLLPNCKIEF